MIASTMLLVAMMIFVAACFRPTRDPEVTQGLVDLAFIVTILPLTNLILWNVVLVVAILGDRREHPAYPRWAAYFNAWCAVLYMPSLALGYFHDGPFAWDGLLGFYVPAVAFAAWTLVMTLLTWDAIRRAAGEDEPVPSMALATAGRGSRRRLTELP